MFMIYLHFMHHTSWKNNFNSVKSCMRWACRQWAVTADMYVPTHYKPWGSSLSINSYFHIGGLEERHIDRHPDECRGCRYGIW